MSLKSELQQYLEADDDLNDLVDRRVFPVELPKGEKLPAVLFSRMPKSPHAHYLSGGAGHSNCLIRTTALGDTYKVADVTGEALRQALQGFSGNMDTVQVDSVVLRDDYDDFYPPITAGEKGTYAVVMIWEILYGETIPTFS